MERDPKNKVIVITGAAEGVGFEIANHFLKAGAKVAIILDINEPLGNEAIAKLNAAFGKGKAIFIKCDVYKDLEAVSKKILEEHKRVDVLVNNAGILDEDQPRKTLEINAISSIEWSMKFWEHMRKDKGGHGGTIINIGSIYSFLVDPFMVFYKASKYALMGFSRSLGHQYNYDKFGVRVLIVCPGLTKTQMTSKQMTWDEHYEDFVELCKKHAWQEAEDVGKGMVEIFEAAESGTAWTIIGGVVEKYKQQGSE